jgi:hypothetical protein
VQIVRGRFFFGDTMQKRIDSFPRSEPARRAPRPVAPVLAPDAIDLAAAEAPLVRLLKPSEAARLLAVTTRTLERWRMTGQGPAYISLSRGTVRYTAAALNAFVEASARTNTAQR